MSALNRRYDLDWIRVVAIGLLLIYHIAIGFQRWGIMIGFITTEKPWESLWTPMTMLNVWRIPLLFFVSGMGVYFAIQNRNWSALFLERAGRILLPFVVGIFLIVPIHLYILQRYYSWNVTYSPNPGHLWFLGNIFIYVIMLAPAFFYLKKNNDGRFANGIRTILSSPLGLLLVAGTFMVEALVVNPTPYEMYAMTWHGFILGLLAFFFGFCFVFSGDTFWQMMLKWRWLFLSIAVMLFTLRTVQGPMPAPGYSLALESDLWIFSVFAFGHKFLNRPGKALNYLSEAAYPVYILHMIFLYLGSLLIFPLNIAVPVQFVLVLLFTITGCFASYELIIRRVNMIRPLFGLKMKNNFCQIKKAALV